MFELVPDITAQRAQLKPDATAFRDLTSGTSLTYAGLEANVQRVAGVFLANGISAGDRVAVLCRNRVEFFELLFACAKAGAAAVNKPASIDNERNFLSIRLLPYSASAPVSPVRMRMACSRAVTKIFPSCPGCTNPMRKGASMYAVPPRSAAAACFPPWIL